MQEQLLTYFAAEKHESLVLVAVGIAAVALSFFLWRTDFKTMIYPLVAIGFIQLGVGGSVFLKTESQTATLTQQLRVEPERFQKEELARMRIVNSSFKIYKTIEILLLIAGIVLSYLSAQNMTLYPIAIGLIAQSAIMLVFDLFAEKRAYDYVAALERMLMWAPY